MFQPHSRIEGLSEVAPDSEASEAVFRVLTDAMPQMVWSTLPDGYHDYYNARWYEFTGVPLGSTDGEEWNGMFHPDDQERAWKRWERSLATGESYEIEYRLRHRSGRYRWTLGRALPVLDRQGKIIRWIGTCTDIDDAKRDAQRTELMSRELSHRIKNIFAVIGGLIGLSAYRDAAHKRFANDLGERIAALGRAHNFARPHSDESRPEIDETRLQRMLGEILSPYEPARITIEGDDPLIDDRSATPIALVVHELATNAAKYGALSAEQGKVTISINEAEPDLRLIWLERGGPRVQGPPAHSGFGSELSEVSIADQLGGRIERRWQAEGLEVLLTVPAASIGPAKT